MNSQTQPGTRVLFADTDAVLCVSARRALQAQGYTVLIAHDGAEALELVAREHFDVAIIGLTLRLFDGVQVLREIKQRTPQMPIILLTDEHSVEIAATTGLREGAFAYLKTPIEDWNQLVDTITQAQQLERMRDQIELFESHFAAEATESAPTPESALSSESEAFALLRLLTEMTRAIKPLIETLDLLLQTTAQIMETTHAVVLLVDADRLQVFRARGAGDIGSARDFIDYPGDALAWRVVSERRTLVETLPARSTQQMIATPLIARDTVLGVLVAYPLSSDTVAPDRIRWLELFAAHGAIAIELERLGVEYEQLLPTDAVTGTMRRAVFLDLADREFRRSWRYNQPIASIIVSVDNLAEIKRADDSQLGSQALKMVATTCRNTIRSIDLLCHYEDDTFALLLLMANPEDAKRVAERLRNGVAALDIANGKSSARLTASIGVCAYPRESCASIFDLLALAQEAQRAARRSGSNQIVYL